MARVSNTLIGKASGSVGNATFSTWKGINVLKEKAVSVANPKTDKQLMRRSAITQVTAIARLVIAVISLGFKKLAVKKSAYNAFQSDALLNAFDYSAPPDAVIDLGLLKISKGSMAQTAIDATTLSKATNLISCDFSPSALQPGQSVSDSVLIAAYNTNLEEWTAAVASDVRSNGTASIAMPSSWAIGNQLQVYLGFYSNVDGGASDSENTMGAIVA